jgi:hypothetical protein
MTDVIGMQARDIPNSVSSRNKRGRTSPTREAEVLYCFANTVGHGHGTVLRILCLVKVIAPVPGSCQSPRLVQPRCRHCLPESASATSPMAAPRSRQSLPSPARGTVQALALAPYLDMPSPRQTPALAVVAELSLVPCVYVCGVVL